MEKEIWKNIKNYKGLYQISNYGKVKSLIKHNGTNERILKLGKRSGYFQVMLCKKQNKKTYYTHRLVLETFIGLCPLNMEACHGDGNKENNFIKNLRWGTHRENSDDQIRHGTTLRGLKNPSIKLNELQVRIIKRLLSDNYLTQQEIAKIFGVSPSLISHIKTKRLWEYLTD